MRKGWIAAGLSVLPLLAAGHGIDDRQADMLQRATGGEWMPFAQAGFVHMLAGWDHFMFVATLLLASRRWSEAAWGVTAFSVGHSITLYLSFGFSPLLPLAAVDASVAITIAVLAAWCRHPSRPSTPAVRGLLAGAGLIHGMGLAGALQQQLAELTPTPGQLLAFNVGVEGAQLLILLLLTLASRPLARHRQALLTVIFVLALGLAGWHAQSFLNPSPPTSRDADVPWRSDVVTFDLPPESAMGGDIEWTVHMRSGAVLVYEWQADAPPARFWSDFHGVADSTGQGQTYRRGLGASAAGSLRAPFDGRHGWYLQNQTREPVRVRLRVSGFYTRPDPAASAP